MTAHEAVRRRAGNRARVLMTAKVISAAGSHPVRVRDISSRGVQIYSDVRLSEDDDVCFQKGSIFLAARVAWNEKNITGLDFYKVLTAPEGELDAVFSLLGDEKHVEVLPAPGSSEE